MVSQLFFKSLRFFSHFTPAGRPVLLVPLLKIIEFIRISIRPLTLGVRLAVKLITGHLMFRMFAYSSNCRLTNRRIALILFIIIGVFILFYERCVCLVQGLVYFLMLTQYLDEHP